MRIPVTGAWSNDTIDLFILEPSNVTARYIAWLNDREINGFLESRFERHTAESTTQFVKKCVSSDNILLLGIRCKWFDNLHIGNVKIEINPHHRLGEVGIMIGEKNVFGKGIASQSIKLLTTIARDELQLRKLTAGCYESNKASEHAFIKAGFMVECKRPEHFLHNGKPEGITLMGIKL